MAPRTTFRVDFVGPCAQQEHTAWGETAFANSEATALFEPALVRTPSLQWQQTASVVTAFVQGEPGAFSLCQAPRDRAFVKLVFGDRAFVKLAFGDRAFAQWEHRAFGDTVKWEEPGFGDSAFVKWEHAASGDRAFVQWELTVFGDTAFCQAWVRWEHDVWGDPAFVKSGCPVLGNTAWLHCEHEGCGNPATLRRSHPACGDRADRAFVKRVYICETSSHTGCLNVSQQA